MTEVANRQNSEEVCPHSSPKFVQIASEPGFRPRDGVPGTSLIGLMGMDQEEFSRRFRKSPVKRAEGRGLLRSGAVTLGNQGLARSGAGTRRCAVRRGVPDPRARGLGAGAIGTTEALAVLGGRVEVEEDSWVQAERTLALEEARGASSSESCFVGNPGAEPR
jgi:epoxyqueuosine reductase